MLIRLTLPEAKDIRAAEALRRVKTMKTSSASRCGVSVGALEWVCWCDHSLWEACDTFRVLGIEFVSLSESLDTATPAGRMVFTVLGAVAELERSLIAERGRAGLRNARAKGKRFVLIRQLTHRKRR